MTHFHTVAGPQTLSARHLRCYANLGRRCGPMPRRPLRCYITRDGFNICPHISIITSVLGPSDPRLTCGAAGLKICLIRRYVHGKPHEPKQSPGHPRTYRNFCTCLLAPSSPACASQDRPPLGPWQRKDRHKPGIRGLACTQPVRNTALPAAAEAAAAKSAVQLHTAAWTARSVDENVRASC
ncbi:hypothetical protein BX600DRAFT_61996 [Xylariales sp. PMI_506]|nr:hypothetical protein BX600DRAFT_61996 [Xylariales sp. PMI_506]